MKRSKAFILVEILTGMILQAGFILILCTSFYLMLSFYTRTQQVLTARQKGEKVIAYVDARIRNVGLGMQACNSSGVIRDALYNIGPLTIAHESGPEHYLTLPAAVTSGDTSQFSSSNFYISQVYEDSSNSNILRGNILTLLYTKRPIDLNMTIKTSEDNTIVSGSNYPVTINTIDIALVSPKYDGKFNFKESDFTQEGTSKNDFNSYTVLMGTGVPLWIDKSNDEGSFKLKFMGGTTALKVYPGDELLYLKCERMFVQENNFKFWNFSGNTWDNEKLHSNELGILEVYFELDTSNNILDMYVLASGGINDSGTTKKPDVWPSDFWKSDYENYTVYVSRASWKLNNIPPGFTWDYL